MKCQGIFKILHLTLSEVVLIAFLVVILGFLSSICMLRIENTSNPNVFITYWGFPFEAIKIENEMGISDIPYDIGRELVVKRTYEYFWCGITVNIIIYLASSTIIVKLVTWIRDEIEYRRYNKL